jgi:hypothetical protein
MPTFFTMAACLPALWVVVAACAFFAALVSYVEIGRNIPGRGATPIFGTHTAWWSAAHRRELRSYREQRLL